MKYKKVIAIFAVMLITGGMIGCNSKEPVSAVPSTTQLEYTIHTEKPIAPNPRTQEEASAFIVHTEVYEDGDIHIEYPQVENLINQEITEFYNEKFKTVLKTVMGKVTEGDIAANATTMDERVRITYQSEDMISILIDGYVYEQGAAHPFSYQKSYNINIKTGETLGIMDEYSTEEIISRLESGSYMVLAEDIDKDGYIPAEDQEFKNMVMDEISSNDKKLLEESIDRCDYDFILQEDNQSLESGKEPYMHSFRLKDGKWVLCVDVSHALGDYAVVYFE